MKHILLRILAVGWFWVWSSTAWAAETGTLRGSVRDGSNQLPLEGVRVLLEGDALPGPRTFVTGPAGTFWFPVVPPGAYRMTCSKDGFQNQAYAATVRLDATTTIPPIELRLVSFVSETIEVIETSPVVDNTQSAAVVTVSEDYIDRLPVSRSYQGVIRTLPGVFGRIDYEDGGPSDGNPSVRGEGRYGNNYLLEGFSTRDPVSKTTGPDFPIDALGELTVYTDGAPAEFGSFTGMLANMILKSGHNETHGTVAYILNTHASTGEYEIMGEPVPKRQFQFHSGVGTLGGPVVPDKLWYFGVYDIQRGWRQLEGADDPSAFPYSYMFASKFTYSPFTDSSTLINLIVQKQASKALSYDADSSISLDASLDGYDDMFSINVNAKSVVSSTAVVEFKWNNQRNRFYAEPSSGTYTIPSYTDYWSGAVTGNTPYAYSTLRERSGMAFHLTRFVTEVFGTHVLKGGYEFSLTGDDEEFIYTGGTGTLENPAYEYLYLDNNENGILEPGEEYLQTAHYNVGALGHESINNTFFVQDQWQPRAGMVLNLGVRVDSEELLQNAGRSVTKQWVYAPRFGLAWDLTQDALNMVSANAGRYYDVNGLGFSNWADTRSSNYYTQCEYDAEDQAYTAACYTQDPVGFPLTYAEDLRPYHLDKLTLGYTRALPQSFAVGIKGILSATRGLPEDVQFNPGRWEITNPSLKRRDYWAIELTAERKFRDNWQALGAITYSRAKGTNPGSFETGSAENTGGSGNEVGVFMDDVADPYIRTSSDYYGYDFAGLGYSEYSGFGQTYDGNSEGWYGYLPYHSFVNIKLNGSYQFDFGTEVGVIYEFDSGHAWQRKGLQDLYGGHQIFPEGRGSRFMPPIHYLDLRVAQQFKITEQMSARAEVTVFNLLDLERPISYYENFNFDDYDAEGNPVDTSFGKVYYRQLPRAIFANVTFVF